MTATSSIPVTIDDPTNVAILSVSEDQLQGFHPDPFGEIARRSGIELPVVLEHIRTMLEAGTIRRVRQTMITTSLAKGSLVAWQVPEKLLSEAFDYMFEQDPFSGHVVIRTTDSVSAGSQYRLWTTLKVPPLFSIEAHVRYLAKQVGAEAFRLMPAKKLFALGVGHTRRREIEPGTRSAQPGRVIETDVIPLDEHEWQGMEVLKREFTPSEIIENPWAPRAKEADLSLNDFLSTATKLQNKGVIGRFATFLEHVKPVADGQRVTRYNALFHWAVPPGQELEAGREVGRHHIMTHAYWREGGAEFRNVNVMGVAHGTDKDRVLEHKAAIDVHLEEAGITIGYTNVFWGGRSEIKPSEISPTAYRTWCNSIGLDPETMIDPKEESADGN